MRAILIPQFVPDPSTLKPSTVPTPAPSDIQYCVRITHASPQHADILHAQGKHQNTHAKRGHVHPPFILGYDFAGVVVSIPEKGNNNLGLGKGDRVFGAAIGAFAEYICVGHERLRKIPDGISNETACAMVGQAVSYASVVNVAKVKRGQTVVVSGASGGLGSVCCMVSKALGAKVIALAGDEEKAASMRKDMDVDSVIVMKGDWIQQVKDFTNGEGADAVLDNVGMVDDAIRCLTYGGRVVILGFAGRKGVMEEVKMNKLLLKSVKVIGYRFGESGRRHPEDLEKIWDGYLRMLQTGAIKPMLYGSYKGLEDIGRALRDLAERKVYGKVVVEIADHHDRAKL